MVNAKISVIIPVYNVSEYLPTCLDSVINQTYKNLEIICVNDGSPDNSAEILFEYAKKDSRIKIITQENQGLSGARNTGLEQISGDYIYFLDSDDYIHPQMLERLYIAAEKENADFACCKYKKVWKKEEPKKLQGRKEIVIENPEAEFFSSQGQISVNVWSKLYRRETVGNMRFIKGLIYEDLPFNGVFMQKAKRGVFVPEEMYYYLQRENTLSQGQYLRKKNAESYIYILRFLHEQMQDSPYYQAMRKKYFTSILRHIIKQKKEKEIKTYLKEELRKLLSENIINYSLLSIKRRIELWILLNL